jgi:hypothetical protein
LHDFLRKMDKKNKWSPLKTSDDLKMARSGAFKIKNMYDCMTKCEISACFLMFSA